MFVRLYRSNKLIATVPVDGVSASPSNGFFGARIAVRSSFIERKTGYKGFANSGRMLLVYHDNYGHWRLSTFMSHYMGSRTGVTFDRVEVLS